MNDPGPDGDRMRQTVKVVGVIGGRSSAANPPELEKEFAQFNELGQMTQRCGADGARFPGYLSNPPLRPALAGRR
jgi:hypothetical protein